MTEQLTDLITGKPLEPWAQQAMEASGDKRIRALATALECTVDEIEDVLTEIIGDSIDMDWTARDGAAAVVRSVKASGSDG